MSFSTKKQSWSNSVFSFGAGNGDRTRDCVTNCTLHSLCCSQRLIYRLFVPSPKNGKHFRDPVHRLSSLFFLQRKNRAGQTLFFHLERETGIEPATSALARLRYTTKPFPHNFLCCPQMFCFYNITNLKSKIKHFNTIFKKNEIFVAVDIFQVETYKILW